MVVSNIYIPKFSTKLSVLFFQNRFSSLNTFLIKLEVPLSRFDRKVPYKTRFKPQAWTKLEVFKNSEDNGRGGAKLIVIPAAPLSLPGYFSFSSDIHHLQLN